MQFYRRLSLWVWLVIVAIVIAGVAVSARAVGNSAPATASCGLEGERGSSSGCPMMGTAASSHDTAMANCPMNGKSHHGQGYTLVTGTVTALDSRHGTITVQMKPASDGAETARALGHVKVGDTLSLAVAVANEGKVVAAPVRSEQVKVSKYVCPMHPEVTSDKPGRCPKCGMDLIPVTEKPK